MTVAHHIIGLCGLAGTGKDTVADVLVAHAGFRKLAFADALRAEVADAFGEEPLLFTRRETKDTPHPRLTLRRAPVGFTGAVIVSLGLADTFGDISDFLDTPRSPRQMLQWWGTEYRRRQHPDYWVHKLTQLINFYLMNNERRFVITDCRFDNEVAALRLPCYHSQLWRVARPGITQANTTEGGHTSANDGSAFGPDHTIHNQGTVHHLRDKVLAAWWAWECGLPQGSLAVQITDADAAEVPA